VCESKTALLQTLACRAGLQRFVNVLFCGVGLFVFAWGRKTNQNALLCQRNTNPVNPFIVIISIFSYRFNVLSCVFTLAYNV